MKPNKSESYILAIELVSTTLAFLLGLYLVPYMVNLNIRFLNQAPFIRFTGIISLIVGLGLLFWLLRFRPKFQPAWVRILIEIFPFLLIEYWYFGTRLLTLITK